LQGSAEEGRRGRKRKVQPGQRGMKKRRVKERKSERGRALICEGKPGREPGNNKS